MAKKDSKNHEVWDCYILDEQPMTCGICGARTSFEEKKNGIQKHQCLNLDCDSLVSQRLIEQIQLVRKI